jgi:hypothetical protein
MYYVSAIWSDYQRLSQVCSSQVHTSRFAAEAKLVTSEDSVVSFQSLEDAKKYVENMSILCEAAWTPNQTPEEKEDNGKRINKANRALNVLDKKAVR